MVYIRVRLWHVALWALAAICMLGQSVRMIYQGVFQPGSYYQPNALDLAFDWFSMLVVGLALFSFAITQLYHLAEKGKEESKESKKRKRLTMRH